MKALIIILLVVAIALNNGFLFFFVALLVALRIGTRLWIERVVRGLRVERQVERRLFFGESIEATVLIVNTSPFRAPWLRLRDHRPLELAAGGSSLISNIFALPAGGTHRTSYRLTAQRRGLYWLGPLTLTAGDVFGLVRLSVRSGSSDYVIVYPRIVPLAQLPLPTQALFGDLRSRRNILGDPARLSGVRPYIPGDPLHHIHWRATASTGTLQVKQFQPATSIQTMLFLDMERHGYTARDVTGAGDLAITIAASLASHLIERRQEVGLVTNGHLALLPQDDGSSAGAIALLAADLATIEQATLATENHAYEHAPRFPAAPIRAGKGHGHLMRILDMLARIEMQEQGHSFVHLLQRESLDLPWGSTVVAITGSLSQELFAVLHRLREAGLLVVLFDVEQRPDRAEMEARAAALGVRLHVVTSPRHMPMTD